MGWAVLIAQSGINNQAVKSLRLDNLKKAYTGETIRFIDENSRSVRGVLLDITDETIIVSEHGGPIAYDHQNISHVFVDPDNDDLYMVLGISALGGAAGYFAVVVGHPDPDVNMKGVVTTLGAGLAGIVGYRSFYKPIKIDISGRAYD